MILERASRWLQARQKPSASWALTQSTIYILPTRAGWAYAATMAVMLLASINYQLNLGYVLTFLLCGAGLVGMQQTHSNLRGLTLRLRSPQPAFAGDPAAIDVVIDNPSGRERPGVGLAIQRTARTGMAWVDVPAHAGATARLSFVPERRGRHRLPTLMAETNFPLGLFRAWTVWRPAAEALVYPRPESPAPPLPPMQSTPGGAPSTATGTGSEFEGVRGWRRGDPQRLIVWKKVARSGDLVSREASVSASRQVWLDTRQAALADPEARLSRLAAWVLAADRLGVSYGLRLPGVELPCAGGPAQRVAALQALACWPEVLAR